LVTASGCQKGSPSIRPAPFAPQAIETAIPATLTIYC
jgi:hypothetical protein